MTSTRTEPPTHQADDGDSTPETLPPLGSRLWLYTNFNCNLACDYCCAESRPRPAAGARELPVALAVRAAEEFAGLGGRELLLTGGEPFLHPELADLVAGCRRFVPEPVTVLTNAMLFSTGRGRRTLAALDPADVVLQVSLDSGTPRLHDLHRGRGSFDRARAGIAVARTAGFRVRVAATIAAADADEEQQLHARLDDDDVPAEDRLVRRVARQGAATSGVELSAATLHPEPTLAVDGAWWHPVAVTDRSMQVASEPLPVVSVLAVIAATLRARRADPHADLQSFRCT